MRQRDLIEKMDATEILEWLAYDHLNDKDYKDKIVRKMQLEAQANQTPEQEGALVIQMFRRLGMYKGK